MCMVLKYLLSECLLTAKGEKVNYRVQKLDNTLTRWSKLIEAERHPHVCASGYDSLRRSGPPLQNSPPKNALLGPNSKEISDKPKVRNTVQIPVHVCETRPCNERQGRLKNCSD